MSRTIANRIGRIRQLKSELAISSAIRLKTDADEIRKIVDAVVDALLDEYPSQDLYIPAPVKYPVSQIRADFRIMSMRALCKKYRCDRRTIYRLLDDDHDGCGKTEDDHAAQVDGRNVPGCRRASGCG